MHRPALPSIKCSERSRQGVGLLCASGCPTRPFIQPPRLLPQSLPRRRAGSRGSKGLVATWTRRARCRRLKRKASGFPQRLQGANPATYALQDCRWRSSRARGLLERGLLWPASSRCMPLSHSSTADTSAELLRPGRVASSALNIQGVLMFWCIIELEPFCRNSGLFGTESN